MEQSNYLDLPDSIAKEENNVSKRSIGVNTAEEIYCTKCSERLKIKDCLCSFKNIDSRISKRLHKARLNALNPRCSQINRLNALNPRSSQINRLNAISPRSSQINNYYSPQIPVGNQSVYSYPSQQSNGTYCLTLAPVQQIVLPSLYNCYQNNSYSASTCNAINKYTGTAGDVGNPPCTIIMESEKKQIKTNLSKKCTTHTTTTKTVKIQNNCNESSYQTYSPDPASYVYQTPSYPEEGNQYNSNSDVVNKDNLYVITNLSSDNTIIEDITDQCK